MVPVRLAECPDHRRDAVSGRHGKKNGIKKRQQTVNCEGQSSRNQIKANKQTNKQTRWGMYLNAHVRTMSLSISLVLLGSAINLKCSINAIGTGDASSAIGTGDASSAARTGGRGCSSWQAAALHNCGPHVRLIPGQQE